MSNLARTSQGHIFFCKVKSHAGMAGNECADRIAKYQASLKDSNLTDTGIPSAGPGGNPFYNRKKPFLKKSYVSRENSPYINKGKRDILAQYNIAWLAQEEARPSLDMQIAKQATTLTTKACYLMQIRASAMPTGTCPVPQPE
eukprot:1156422-Pelagomonas_calceolata.AAC.2